MVLRKGNLWSATQPDMYIVTCNKTIRADGAVVMGRGAALEMLTMYPGCNRVFGGLIRQHAISYGHSQPYGIVIDPYRDTPKLGLFQVKNHFRDDAELSLIEYSVDRLLFYATGSLSETLIYMNFPGIGFGRRKRDEILPLIQKLPDNIVVWELE